MKLLKEIGKYLLFLAIGAFIFWWVYKDLEIKQIVAALKEVNYFWIAVSICLSLLSHLSRAVRWNMLIRPLGYNPKLYNTFLSILVLYFTNLVLPRAGEVARCAILSKYEKIPATKLVGTMIVERIADMLMLMVLAVIIFAVNFGVLKRFFDLHPEFGQNIVGLLTITNILLVIAVIALIVALILLFKPHKRGKINHILKKIKGSLKDGIKSILKLENKWYFIGHTIFIFLMWLLMLYAVFLAYPPTRHLSIWAGMFIFLMGSFGMLMPVQGGIGPWHFMVMESLFLYGISKTDGQIFALIAHTSTSLIYLLFGGIAFLIFPLVNIKSKETAVSTT